MSTYSNFEIKAENCEKAFLSFKKKYQFDDTIDVNHMECIDDALYRFDFQPIYDDDGNIVELDTVDNEEPNGLHEFFRSIAEFVENGSGVTVAYESGKYCKYVFQNGTCEELIGEVVYPERKDGITYDRAMNLLREVVEHSCTARKSFEAVEELVRIGFTDDELINDFNFCKDDVKTFMKEHEGNCGESNAVPNGG